MIVSEVFSISSTLSFDIINLSCLFFSFISIIPFSLINILLICPLNSLFKLSVNIELSTSLLEIFKITSIFWEISSIVLFFNFKSKFLK